VIPSHRDGSLASKQDFSEGDDMAKTAESKSLPDAPAESEQPDATPRADPTHEEIALRAYHIYLERGSAEGSPIEDWRQAERELAESQ
jgi:hypothetical protein